MISALLEPDRATVERYFNKHSCTFCEGAECLLVKDREEVLAYSLFYLDKKGIELAVLVPEDDIALADFTLRSTLHIAAERCAMDARFADTAPKEVLEKLGFILDKEQKTLDIDKLFRPCGGCEK